MISYESYKILHLAAVLVLFAALGGASVLAMTGGPAPGTVTRRVLGAVHGLALLVVLIGGFGLVARLGLSNGGLPLWVWGKLLVWLAAGLLLTLLYRKPRAAGPVLLIGLPLLATIATWLAVLKPGD